MRRVSLLLIVCLLVQAVAVPLTNGGTGQQGPAKPLPLPNQQVGMILSGLLDSLQETTDAMQPAAAADALAGWVYVLELEQQRLAAATEAIAAELTAFGRYLAQAGFPATVRARHAQAARQVQARLAELNRQLDTLIREPTPANFQPLADTLAAGRPAPVVPDLTALPFGPVRASLPVIMAVPPLAPERPLPVSTGAPEWADQALDLAPEAATSEALAALQAAVAQAGTRPADLAAWVAGRVTPDWYPARQQDPAQVLASGRANDADAAMLLVTLLRLAGVPARYGTGYVSLKPADWAALLGLENGEAAKEFLAAAGIPLQVQIGPQREVLELTLPHVWVEYWDSGRWHATEPLWRQQPAAQVRWIPDLDLRQYILYVRDRSPLDATVPRRIALEANAASEPKAPPQPLLLPARAAHAGAALPAGWAGHVSVELPGLQVQLPLAQASTGALQLAFEPATADDAAVLERWWGSWVPSYLVTYQPVLRLGTQELGRGDPMPGGSPVPLQVAVQAGTWQEQVRHSLTAGAAYGLLVTGTATPAAAARGQVQTALGATGLTAAGPKGATLAALAWQYQAQVEDSARRLAVASGIPAVQGPRITVSAFAFETYWLLGIPYLSELRGVGLHAARVAVSPVHPDGDEFAERIYTILMAAEAAYQEGQTTQELYGVPGQSTVSLLQAAADRNTTIHWVCRANGDKALPPLDADAGTRTHVKEAFDQGLFVVAPFMAYRTGGYILIDPNTGASGYYLANGTNGLLGEQETLLRPVFTGQGLTQGGILGPGLLRWLIRTPEVSRPAPVPEVAQFKDIALKVNTPWDLREPDGLPCADADQFLREATGVISPMQEGCEALRALLRGLSQGLADGGYFGLEGDMADWAGIPASLTALARFVKDADYRTQFLAEVRQALGQLWAERATIAAGIAEAVGNTLKQKSPFAPDDDRFVPWALGYSVGWVAGLIMEASANLGPPLTVGGAVVALGGLLAVGVTSGLVKFFRLVRDLPGARGGGLTLHVVALARRFVAEERGSLYLGALLARDIEDLRLHARFVAEAARLGGDTALLAEIRDGVWQVYWRGLNEARKRAEGPEASWLDKQNVERFLAGLRAATGKASVPETIADEVARRQLQVLGMAEREYHLVRTMPVESLADEHVDVIRAVRLGILIPRAPGTYMIKAMKADIGYAIVNGGTLPDGTPATSAYFGHVTFSPFVPGARTSLDYRGRLVLDSVAPSGFHDEDDLIAIFSTPVDKLPNLETQLGIPFHPRFGGSNYQYVFPSSGNGVLAYFEPVTIPEWLVAVKEGILMPSDASRSFFVDSRGRVHDVYERRDFREGARWVRLGP